MSLPRVLAELLALPTAAFVETAVMDYIRAACEKLPGVTLTTDKHGNLLAHYRHEPRGTTPLVFTAHTDHPGFCALRMLDDKTLLAAFRGWVEPEYFKKERVRFFSGGRWVRGRVKEIVKAAPIFGMIGRTGRPEQVAIKVKAVIEPNSAGMWDLPEAKLRGGKVYARGCDDIAGCAALLAMLQRLDGKRAAGEIYVLFTRAEEVGFIGAIGAARDGTIPGKLPIVAIETSKAIPGVTMGAGPVLRVGDKTSIFTPELTAFCDRVAKELMQRDGTLAAPQTKQAKRTGAKTSAKKTPKHKGFAYQRKLMDGGTCESTAYFVYGYPATGICVALGNYHNMDEKRKRIDSEYISLRDWEWMVDWFEALALDERGFGGESTALRESLEKRFAEYAPLLA